MKSRPGGVNCHVSSKPVAMVFGVSGDMSATHQSVESASPQSSSHPQASPSNAQIPHTARLSTASVLSSPSSQRDSLAASLSEGHGSLMSSMLDEPWNDCTVSLMGTDGDVVEESQFIMPTVTVSNRTPFTATGKLLGRLKMLVAGPKG